MSVDKFLYKGHQPYCIAWYCHHKCSLKVTRRIRERAAVEFKPIGTRDPCPNYYVTFNKEKK